MSVENISFNSQTASYYKKIYEDAEIEDAVESLKNTIEILKIEKSSLTEQEQTYAIELIRRNNLQENAFIKDELQKDDIDIINCFIQTFCGLNNHKKQALVAQRLFNSNYSFQDLHYFFPIRILSMISSTSINDYINFRDPDFKRILRPKGTRFVIESWLKAEKLSPNLKYIVCEDVYILKNEIELLKNKASLDVFFFLQMSDNESMLGDHTVPIFFTKEGSVIITDSASVKKDFLKLTVKFLQSCLPETNIYAFSQPRQVDSNSCCMFALNDAKFIGNNLEEIKELINQNSKFDENMNCYLFDILPEEMMELSQYSSWIRQNPEKAQALSENKLIINSKSSNDGSIEYLKKRGVLISKDRLQYTTNFFANKIFAKIERKILEKCFSKDE